MDFADGLLAAVSSLDYGAIHQWRTATDNPTLGVKNMAEDSEVGFQAGSRCV